MRLAPRVSGVLAKWQAWNLADARSRVAKVRVRPSRSAVHSSWNERSTHQMRGGEATIRQRERWGVLGNGEMVLTQEVQIPREFDDLPRLGMLLRLHGGLEQLHYYGRGPEENYADRQFGYPLGRYASTVDDEYVPYVTPQEHGNHTDVRWLALTTACSGCCSSPMNRRSSRSAISRRTIFTQPDTRSI